MAQGLVPIEDREELKNAWIRYLDIVEPMRPALHRYCRRMTGSVFEAEDLVQDTLLRGFGSIGRKDSQRNRCSEPGDVRNPRAYLFRIATNLWIDRISRSTRDPKLVEAPPIHENEAEKNIATREALSVLMERNSPQESAALVLKEVFDFTLEEIADILTTSIGAVKSALHRSRDSLKKESTNAMKRRKISPELIDRFVDAFNAHDALTLAGLLLETVSIEVEGVGGERGRDANWIEFAMDGYSGDRWDGQWIERRTFEDEAIVVHWRKSDGQDAIEEVWRFEEEDGLIGRIRDYCYCPETLTEIASVLGVPVITHGYHMHPTTKKISGV
ncbi:MAG TPA: sigma-70 family RNA polymerase sigma factor [Candidatus Binataceae bacterium]|nr:sigma-70 family RNA polymerase sigma factor [Candidatus Binataceae bacterium]